jgi:thiosulfate/3-mercaptopyruvate sulfurtransferase
MKRAVAVLSLLAGLAVPGLFAADAPSRVVGPQWLVENLTNPKVRILDLRGDIRDYWESHIPGAVYLDVDVLRWPDRGVPGKLMPPASFVRLLGEMGIGRDTIVVVYSEVNHYRAAYILWALDYIKHPDWAVLLGGFEVWKRGGGAVSQDYPKIAPVAYAWNGPADASVRATTAEVRDRDAATTVLIDVRPADLYSGEKGAWKRKGHIKGAVPRFWADDLNNDGSWKDPEVLRKAYAAVGATPDKTIIVSCGQGQMAAHSYVTLKYILGFPRVRLYDGSFSEWSNVDSLPVESK